MVKLIAIMTALAFGIATSSIPNTMTKEEMDLLIKRSASENRLSGDLHGKYGRPQRKKNFMSGDFEENFKAVHTDVPFIVCDTCKTVIREAAKAVKGVRAKKKHTKVNEIEISEIVDDICNPKTYEGSWLTFYDMVQFGNERIELKKYSVEGSCTTKCKTIMLACKNIIDEIGYDLSEKLYLDKMSKKELTKQLCCKKSLNGMSGACGSKYPTIPEDRDPGLPFQPLPDMNKMGSETPEL